MAATTDDAPPKFKSPAARQAEAEFEKAVAIANDEYQAKIRQAHAALMKDLGDAQSAATKGGDLDDALAIRDRIKQRADSVPAPRKTTPSARDKLELDLADSTWTGSPGWGPFALKSDGSVKFELVANRTEKWGAISPDTIAVVDSAGRLSMLVFDRDRRQVRAYYAGQMRKKAWDATRASE